MSKSPKWEDWVGIGLGVWLSASPWILGFSHETTPTVNALLVGIILVLGESVDLVVGEIIRRHRARHRNRHRDPEPLFGLA
jgi:hypothetical protein